MIDLDIEDPIIKNRIEHKYLEDNILELELKFQEMKYIIEQIRKEVHHAKRPKTHPQQNN